jgi:hypothetical protein
MKFVTFCNFGIVWNVGIYPYTLLILLPPIFFECASISELTFMLSVELWRTGGALMTLCNLPNGHINHCELHLEKFFQYCALNLHLDKCSIELILIELLG